MWAEVINGTILQTVQDTDQVQTQDGTNYPSTWPKGTIPNFIAVVLAAEPDPTQYVVLSSTVTLVNGVPTQTITTGPIPPLSNAELAAQGYAAAISQGISCTSSPSNPSLVAVFSVSANVNEDGNTDQSNIAVEQQFISNFNEFTNGTTTSLNWVLQNESWVTFTSLSQFTQFAKFAAQYVAAAKVAALTQMAGGTPTWPTNTFTIT